MFILKLYHKDLDNPIVVLQDPDQGVLLDRLYSRLDDDGSPRNQAEADGLTLQVDDPEWPHQVILFYDGVAWCIEWGFEASRRFRIWGQARNAFIDACSHQLVWQPDRCPNCETDCRVSFPACEAAR